METNLEEVVHVCTQVQEWKIHNKKIELIFTHLLYWYRTDTFKWCNMEISSVDLFKLPVQTLHVRESDKNYLEALEGVKNK